MAALANWYPDRNPFGLAAPPKWFLSELAAFDDQLILAPSRQEPVYRLLRRTKHTAGVKFSADMQSTPDTRMAAQYSALPVTSVFPGLVVSPWRQEFFNALAARDIWRAGGAAKAAKAVEDHEAEQTRQLDARIEDEAGERAKDAYLAWMMRTGQSSGYRPPLPRRPMTRLPANTTGGSLGSPVDATRPTPQLVVATS